MTVNFDTRIENGDVFLNLNGVPETVHGKAECLQRAKRLLMMKAGSFRYDKSLGSGIYEVKDGEHYEERLLSAANEALMSHGVKAQSARISEGDFRFEILTPFGMEEITIKQEKEEENGT